VALGGGRRRATDPVDPRVGLTRVLPVGSKVRAGDPLLRVHAANAADADAALRTLVDALPIGDGPALPDPPVVRGVVGRPGRSG
jgi:thymidine phosphorylase